MRRVDRHFIKRWLIVRGPLKCADVVAEREVVKERVPGGVAPGNTLSMRQAFEIRGDRDTYYVGRDHGLDHRHGTVG